MSTLTCKRCGAMLRRARIVLHWPSDFRCRRCNARHTVPFAHGVGVVMAVTGIATVLAFWAAPDSYAISQGYDRADANFNALFAFLGIVMGVAVPATLYGWWLGLPGIVRLHAKQPRD